MKIEEMRVGEHLRDSWGNTLEVETILKTRVKLKFITMVNDDHFKDYSIGSTVTYDRGHCQFLNKINQFKTK